MGVDVTAQYSVLKDRAPKLHQEVGPGYLEVLIVPQVRSKVRDAAILRAEGEAKAIALRGQVIKNAPEVVQLTFAEKLAPGVQTIFVPSRENCPLDLRGPQGGPKP
ncbi:SPFH domain-containing protein [Thermus sp. LT1-2-5]|uniref:SPFH domain-containing protein n=1 Tax=Thermus sp. LT1-2-5 TaxID=3026935 RepID=UPI00336538F1